MGSSGRTEVDANSIPRPTMTATTTVERYELSWCTCACSVQWQVASGKWQGGRHVRSTFTDCSTFRRSVWQLRDTLETVLRVPHSFAPLRVCVCVCCCFCFCGCHSPDADSLHTIVLFLFFFWQQRQQGQQQQRQLHICFYYFRRGKSVFCFCVCFCALSFRREFITFRVLRLLSAVRRFFAVYVAVTISFVAFPFFYIVVAVFCCCSFNI